MSLTGQEKFAIIQAVMALAYGCGYRKPHHCPLAYGCGYLVAYHCPLAYMESQTIALLA